VPGDLSGDLPLRLVILKTVILIQRMARFQPSREQMICHNVAPT
jgi:hypothetical protein